ncbi:hypothetical protein [Flavimobilis rhizosphaerae]|uniref:hypothetical protein n=1 Tax=Flavimobilis rhizosphaerae TaxID=2775421 RepID=UPI001F185520|nr:hypothetical protein [Flavimobilis rhizosphaerae]
MANSSPIWKDLPGLTACSLCAGETLGESDTEGGGQLQRLQRLAESGVARLTTVECLDLCECGDAVVARPTRASRGAGARPVWFERLAGDEATAELADWLRSGGPGATELPGGLASNVIQRSDAVSGGPSA